MQLPQLLVLKLSTIEMLVFEDDLRITTLSGGMQFDCEGKIPHMFDNIASEDFKTFPHETKIQLATVMVHYRAVYVLRLEYELLAQRHLSQYPNQEAINNVAKQIPDLIKDHPELFSKRAIQIANENTPEDFVSYYANKPLPADKLRIQLRFWCWLTMPFITYKPDFLNLFTETVPALKKINSRHDLRVMIGKQANEETFSAMHASVEHPQELQLWLKLAYECRAGHFVLSLKPGNIFPAKLVRAAETTVTAVARLFTSGGGGGGGGDEANQEHVLMCPYSTGESQLRLSYFSIKTQPAPSIYNDNRHLSCHSLNERRHEGIRLFGTPPYILQSIFNKIPGFKSIIRVNHLRKAFFGYDITFTKVAHAKHFRHVMMAVFGHQTTFVDMYQFEDSDQIHNTAENVVFVNENCSNQLNLFAGEWYLLDQDDDTDDTLAFATQRAARHSFSMFLVWFHQVGTNGYHAAAKLQPPEYKLPADLSKHQTWAYGINAVMPACVLPTQAAVETYKKSFGGEYPSKPWNKLSADERGAHMKQVAEKYRSVKDPYQRSHSTTNGGGGAKTK
jgi:hypothetical protein